MASVGLLVRKVEEPELRFGNVVAGSGIDDDLELADRVRAEEGSFSDMLSSR